MLRIYTQQETRRRDVGLGSAAMLIGLSWTLLLVYVLHAAMPFNPIGLPGEASLGVRSLLPQGWRFFTKDPQELRLLYYLLTASGWESAMLAPHAAPRNSFGLDRRSRAQGVEAASLANLARPSDWSSCHQSFHECVAALRPVLEVRNLAPNPTLCGEIAFSRQSPLPWACSKRAAHSVMPSQLVRLRALC